MHDPKRLGGKRGEIRTFRWNVGVDGGTVRYWQSTFHLDVGLVLTQLLRRITISRSM